MAGSTGDAEARSTVAENVARALRTSMTNLNERGMGGMQRAQKMYGVWKELVEREVAIGNETCKRVGLAWLLPQSVTCHRAIGRRADPPVSEPRVQDRAEASPHRHHENRIDLVQRRPFRA